VFTFSVSYSFLVYSDTSSSRNEHDKVVCRMRSCKMSCLFVSTLKSSLKYYISVVVLFCIPIRCVVLLHCFQTYFYNNCIPDEWRFLSLINLALFYLLDYFYYFDYVIFIRLLPLYCVELFCTFLYFSGCYHCTVLNCSVFCFISDRQ